MARRALTLEDHVYRRAGHVMVAYKNQLFLWGGYMEDPHEENYNLMTQSLTHYHTPDEIWIYDPLLDTWSRKICQGDIPPPLSGACAAVHGDYMYLFGGYNGEWEVEEYTSNKLWFLYLPSLTWKFLSPSGFKPNPCDKSACWVYKNRFYIFGGFGFQMSSHFHSPVDISFEPENSSNSYTSRGWVDQLAYYDTDENRWFWPKTRGEKPSARAAHAAAVLGDRAFIFGGRHKTQRLNDFYFLDMTNHMWNKVIYSDPSSPIPCGRSWHTLNAISPDKIVLYGGFSTSCEVLNDVWMFDSFTWQWLNMPRLQLKFRLWHRADCIQMGELVIVGGISNNILDYSLIKDHADDMVILRFSPPSLFMLAIEYVCRKRKLLKSSWKTLPQNMRQLLEFRTDNERVHGIWDPLLISLEK